MSGFGYDPYSVEPDDGGSFELLKNGVYKAMISKAEMAQTKAGDDKLDLVLEIDGDEHPDYANRKIFETLNIGNSSQKARDIARGQLRSICDAFGDGIEDPEDLVGGDLLIRVGTQKASGDYDARNVVKGFKSLEDGDPESSKSDEPEEPEEQEEKPAKKKKWQRS